MYRGVGQSSQYRRLGLVNQCCLFVRAYRRRRHLTERSMNLHNGPTISQVAGCCGGVWATDHVEKNAAFGAHGPQAHSSALWV